MAEYRFRPKARTDIEDIWNYSCRAWGVRQARQYVERLRDVCTDLARTPDIGKIRDELYAGLRVYPSGKHILFYLVVENGIDVVRVLHERMNSKLHLP